MTVRAEMSSFFFFFLKILTCGVSLFVLLLRIFYILFFFLSTLGLIGELDLPFSLFFLFTFVSPPLQYNLTTRQHTRTYRLKVNASMQLTYIIFVMRARQTFHTRAYANVFKKFIESSTFSHFQQMLERIKT